MAWSTRNMAIENIGAFTTERKPPPPLRQIPSILLHAFRQLLFLRDALFRRVLPHILADLRRAEVRAARGAEVGGTGAGFRRDRGGRWRDQD